MGGISFEKDVCKAKLLNPFLNFAVETHPIEYRRDPLTGKWECRINMKRDQRIMQVANNRESDTLENIDESKRECFFCPENLESETPRFANDLIPEGRMRVGSACLFPNLYPFGEYHSIAVFSEDHYLGLNQFSSRIIEDCIKVTKEYFDRVSTNRPRIKYSFINWNYMPPAGASIVHPHLQILAEHKPTSKLENLIKNSEAYFEKHGSSYWSDLREKEKRIGERFIGETGRITWLASYAPQGNNEISGMFSDISTISEMTESHIRDFSRGLSRILYGYREIGVNSFNMTTYSGPLDHELSYFSLHIKVISRPNLKAFYTSDCGFMERLQGETVVETKPEDVAEELKEILRKHEP